MYSRENRHLEFATIGPIEISEISKGFRRGTRYSITFHLKIRRGDTYISFRVVDSKLKAGA